MKAYKYIVFTRHERFDIVNTYNTVTEARKHKGRGHIYKLVE
jgi:hypothetical protein